MLLQKRNKGQLKFLFFKICRALTTFPSPWTFWAPGYWNRQTRIGLDPAPNYFSFLHIAKSRDYQAGYGGKPSNEKLWFAIRYSRPSPRICCTETQFLCLRRSSKVAQSRLCSVFIVNTFFVCVENHLFHKAETTRMAKCYQAFET